MTGVALTRSTHTPCEGCASPFVIPNEVRNLASKREEILRFALNDKRLDADMNIPPAPLQGEKRSVGKTGTPLGGGLKA